MASYAMSNCVGCRVMFVYSFRPIFVPEMTPDASYRSWWGRVSPLNSSVRRQSVQAARSTQRLHGQRDDQGADRAARLASAARGRRRDRAQPDRALAGHQAGSR